MLIEQSYRLLTVRCFGDNGHISLGVDQGGQSAPDNIMIISDEQLDSIWSGVRQGSTASPGTKRGFSEISLIGVHERRFLSSKSTESGPSAFCSVALASDRHFGGYL